MNSVDRHGTHSSISRSFSPWKKWTSTTSICFHDRISKGIKDKTLSTDKIAFIVLQLLTRSKEVASELLRELQYVDSPQAHEINVPSLETAQRRISEAVSLIKRENDADSKRTLGDRMLHKYVSIIRRCYSSMLALNTVYNTIDKWLYVHDERCLRISQTIVMLANAIDAMQQCLALECNSDSATRSAKELDESLAHANQALRIVVNAFNAISLPIANRQKILAEKSVLATNTSILMCTFKLLDMAARQAFSVHTYGKYRLGIYDRISDIKRCCGFRVAVLRTKALEYLNMSCRNSTQQSLYAAIWALDQLYDEMDTISRGTYAYSARNLRYTTRMCADITECMTILSLLRVAHKKAKKQNSAIAKIIEQNSVLVKNARELCLYLESCKAYGDVADGDIRKLYDILAYLEHVVCDLTSINKSHLLYSQWSAHLLDQAIKTAGSACNTCASELKSAELRTLREGNGPITRSDLFTVLDLLCRFVSAGVRYVSAQEGLLFAYNGQEGILNVQGVNRGGEYSDIVCAESDTTSLESAPGSVVDDTTSSCGIVEAVPNLRSAQ